MADVNTKGKVVDTLVLLFTDMAKKRCECPFDKVRYSFINIHELPLLSHFSRK